MKITDLEEYTKLQNEIKQLENRIQKYKKWESDMVADTVKDYRYGERVIVIRGYSLLYSDKISSIRSLLEKHKECLEAKREEIESYICTINDTEVRQIIGYKYIDGETWLTTAMKVYGQPCNDRARKKVIRFFEKK